MIICDRCNKLADSVVNITPSKGSALCERCRIDLQFLIGSFLSGQPFTVNEVDKAESPINSDPNLVTVSTAIDALPVVEPPIVEPPII